MKRGGYKSGVTATGVSRLKVNSAVTPTYRYSQDVTANPLLKQSQAKYGVKETTYKIPEIGVTDANDIAAKVAESYCDSEQSIGFKVKEMHIERDSQGAIGDKYWQKYFPSFTQVDEIYDYSNDLIISNMSNFPCAKTSKFKPSNTTYDDDRTIEVPRGTVFRIEPMDIPTIIIYNNWQAGVGYYTSSNPPEGFYTSLKVFDMNDRDISNEVSITIINDGEEGSTGMNYPVFDIRIDRPCYMRMFESYITLLGAKRYNVGGKLMFTIKNERKKLPNKLCLSTFEHNFPEGTTKYWFGIMKPTDISQNSSEISSALYNQ